MSKGARQRLIADWLRSTLVGSQEELVTRLDHAGIVATQATVSRDLDEIGAIKARRDGNIRYLLPETLDPDHAAAKLDRLLAEWVAGIATAGPLVILRTPPGSANVVAKALDSAGIEGVAGTIAGDDTIFVAVADGMAAGRLAETLAERRNRG